MEEYFPVFEKRHPGGLASQWIPDDPKLWKIGNFNEFLEARRELLAAEANKRLAELLHGDLSWLEGAAKPAMAASIASIAGGITSEAEEEEIESLNDWVESLGLPRGDLLCRNHLPTN